MLISESYLLVKKRMEIGIDFIILIILTVAVLIWSFLKSKQKTTIGLKITKGRFLDIFGELFGILALIGLFFSLVPNESIKMVLGGPNPLLSTIYGAMIGTVTIIPAFVAFPLAKSLVNTGAHLFAVAAFITTLTMVGFLTAPIEIKFFGKKFTLIRNLVSFLIAICIAIGMGLIL